jgi:hypothetical protein
MLLFVVEADKRSWQCSRITNEGVAQLRAALPPQARVRFSLVTRKARQQPQPHQPEAPRDQDDNEEEKAEGEQEAGQAKLACMNW